MQYKIIFMVNMSLTLKLLIITITTVNAVPSPLPPTERVSKGNYNNEYKTFIFLYIRNLFVILMYTYTLIFRWIQ